MNPKSTLQALIIIATSVGVGYFMSAVMVHQPLRDMADHVPGSMPVYGIIHAPAQAMAEGWQALHLPPHGDDALVLYPRAVVIQWLLIGAVMAWQYTRRQNRRAKRTR